MKKPSAHAREMLADYERLRLAFQRQRSMDDFGRLGADDEPVIRCAAAGCFDAATWWLCRPDGREALRCGRHSLAVATTERREIDPFDWRSLPADPFTRNEKPNA